MKYNTQDLINIKQKIYTEESKRLIIGGILSAEMRQLKERFGVASIKEAEKLLQNMKQKLKAQGVIVK